MILDEKVVIFSSLVGCFFSAIILLVCWRVIDTGNKIFYQVIIYIAICDCLMNAWNAIGFPPDGSFWCWAQGLNTFYFAMCSWFWTVFLCYTIYSVVLFGKFNCSLREGRWLCFGVPLVLVLLPLTTSNYGQVERMPQWCIIVARGSNPAWLVAFWNYAACFAWAALCSVLLIIMQIRIYLRFERSVFSEIVRKTYDKIYLYPIALILCLLIYAVVVSIHLHDDYARLFLTIGMVTLNMYSVITACIFLYKSEEAQQGLRRMFCRKEGQLDNDPNATTAVCDSADRTDFIPDDELLRLTRVTMTMGSSTANVDDGDNDLRDSDVAGAYGRTSDIEGVSSACGARSFGMQQSGNKESSVSRRSAEIGGSTQDNSSYNSRSDQAIFSALHRDSARADVTTTDCADDGDGDSRFQGRV